MMPQPGLKISPTARISQGRGGLPYGSYSDREQYGVDHSLCALYEDSGTVTRRHNKICYPASESDDGSPPGPWRTKTRAVTIDEELLRRILREEISAGFRVGLEHMREPTGRDDIIHCEKDPDAIPGYWLANGDGSPQSWLQQKTDADLAPNVEPPSANTGIPTDPALKVKAEQSTRGSVDTAIEMPGWMAEPEYKVEPGNIRQPGTVDLGTLELKENIFESAKEHVMEYEVHLFQNLVARYHLEAAVDHVAAFLREPTRNGKLAKAVDSTWFEWTSAIMIVGNGLTMYFRANWDVQHPLSDVPPSILTVESFFMIFFGVELLLKIAVHHAHFFFESSNFLWNWFDFLLVLISIIQVVQPNNSGNLMFIRMLRCMKTAKVLRVFRLMRFLSELRLILNCIIGSFISLFWSLVMMAMILYMFALLFVQATGGYLMDTGSTINDPENNNLHDCFGTVGTAMLSLFMVCTGGNDWGYFFNALEPLAVGHKAVFLFFIAFSQIALLNILTGIFVENAMKCAEPDKDARCLDRARSDSADIKALTSLCSKMDPDHKGTINMHEFAKQLHTEGSDLRMTFFDMGLHTADAVQFFKLLDKHSGEEGVDIESFVQGVLKLKGGATSLDMQAIHFQAKVLMKMMKDLKQDVKDVKAAQKFMTISQI